LRDKNNTKSKDYPQISRFVSESSWAILPDTFATIMEILNRHKRGDNLSEDEMSNIIQEARAERQEIPVINGTAVIPIHGVIAPKMNTMTEMSGGTSLDMFGSQLTAAIKNSQVDHIVLDIDSPGGIYAGVPEAAAMIREAKAIKPITAVINNKALSAGYYLAAQATEITCPPTGSVGSIGVFTAHEDHSKEMEMEGVKTTLISAGKYKVEGNPFEPLSPEARAYAQDRVDEEYQQFVSDVAEGRGTNYAHVHNHFGEGRVISAEKALETGMIDRVETLEQAFGTLTHTSVGFSSAAGQTGQVFTTKAEVADLEHSEPGSGSPPTPRETPKEKDASGGWRTDTPDEFKNDEEAKGGSIVNREQLIAYCEKLGIQVTAEDTDETLSAKFGEALDGVVSAAPEDTTSSFQTQFPEEFARMVEYEADRRASKAREFSKAYLTPGTTGFSSLVVDKIEDAHLKVLAGTVSEDDLKELLDLALAGVVDYNELGSNKGKEPTEDSPQAFVARVDELKVAGQTHAQAVKQATTELPKAAGAYKNAAKPA
jgi:signal peptide peptidase SppA